MAVSNVSICNKALILLGGDTISSLTDDTKAAILCNNIFDITKNSLLRVSNWNFAVKRLALALNVATPAWGYSFSYSLPQDFLRLLEKEDENIYPFKIEGRALLTDDPGSSSSINIRYISKIDDPNLFDALFVDLLAARLAVELATPLTDSATRKKEAIDLYRSLFPDSVFIDSLEEPIDQMPEGSWVTSRIDGVS